ncbi:MAG TPA: aminotransferase class III-fold pyridoxal phosphate-dependent enzyme, partial [Candidatus Limnocylindrales bacterium]|nr:aminotransferase class III-fold pyridoxal phosphate-dependent enzyme [Candidatus Limnocylindrales bacterium]
GVRAAAAGRATVGDVRGLGCMVALEFVEPGSGDPPAPAPELAKRVIAEALARRLIVLSAGTWGQVVRVIPPLVTTADEVEQAVAVLAESLDAARA